MYATAAWSHVHLQRQDQVLALRAAGRVRTRSPAVVGLKEDA
jgi:hypothetical protein